MALPENISTFPKQVKNQFEPHDGLVKMLEGMLESAKAGKLTACAVSCVYHDDLDAGDGVSEGWQMSPGTKYALSHSIVRLRILWEKSIMDKAG